jgi:hypothetical protein
LYIGGPKTNDSVIAIKPITKVIVSSSEVEELVKVAVIILMSIYNNKPNVRWKSFKLAYNHNRLYVEVYPTYMNILTSKLGILKNEQI